MESGYVAAPATYDICPSPRSKSRDGLDIAQHGPRPWARSDHVLIQLVTPDIDSQKELRRERSFAGEKSGVCRSLFDKAACFAPLRTGLLRVPLPPRLNQARAAWLGSVRSLEQAVRGVGGACSTWRSPRGTEVRGEELAREPTWPDLLEGVGSENLSAQEGLRRAAEELGLLLRRELPDAADRLAGMVLAQWEGVVAAEGDALGAEELDDVTECVGVVRE